MKNKSWFEGQVVEQNLDGKTVEFWHSECELMGGVDQPARLHTLQATHLKWQNYVSFSSRATFE